MPGVGKVCALLCWECWVVLARYTLLARGCEFFFAPTQDLGASWSAHVKAMARDGGVSTLSYPTLVVLAEPLACCDCNWLYATD
jgi:nitrilase